MDKIEEIIVWSAMVCEAFLVWTAKFFEESTPRRGLFSLLFVMALLCWLMV